MVICPTAISAEADLPLAKVKNARFHNRRFDLHVPYLFGHAYFQQQEPS
jgi:hypothetical protein